MKPAPDRAPDRSTGRPRPPNLLDILALVVGYGMAALMIRAYWPYREMPDVRGSIVLVVAYAWLGLAMSGPFVLLLNRRRRLADSRLTQGVKPIRTRPATLVRPGPEPTAPVDPTEGDPYTRAEYAWLMIGVYWITVAILVVPARVPRITMTTLSVLPIALAFVLWLLSRGPRRGPSTSLPWTHRAAVALLATWPLVWIAMILLSHMYL